MADTSSVGQQNGNSGEQNADSGESVEPKTNLIINYLPPNMTHQELLSIFSTVGIVHTCNLIRDKATDQSFGYAFVNYYRPEDAERAIKTLNGLQLQNKFIKVSYARPRSADILKANLYVSGFPRDWSLEDFEALFRPYGRIITSKILYSYIDKETNQRHDLSRRVGFIRFDKRMEAEIAIRELNGTKPLRCSIPIEVKFARTQGGLNHPAVTRSTYQTSQATCRYCCPTYYSAESFKYSPLCGELPQNLMVPVNARNDLGWCIFIYNLIATAEECVLWQLFGSFGAVLNVKIIRDPVTNNCKGYGFVTMAYFDEAVVAINMLNGHTFQGRVLQVKFKTN